MRPKQPKQRVSHFSRKDAQKLRQRSGEEEWSRLLNKSLLAKLSEGTRLDRMWRVADRVDRRGFELMGHYTNPLWNQMAFLDDCILVDIRLAVPNALRSAVTK